MIPEDFNSLDYYQLNKEQIEGELDYSFGDLNKTLQKHYEDYGHARGLIYRLDIPEDFDLTNFLEINPELKGELRPLKLNLRLDRLAYSLAIKHNFPYKLNIPEDFSVEGYKKYNPDIASMSDKDTTKHYSMHGKAEGRVYMLGLPSDFCVKNYKRYNPDLEGMQDIEAEKHYIAFGANEGRLYTVNLPDDFEAGMYSYMNPDLEGLSSAELEKHYFEHGCREKREYRDPLYDGKYFSEKYAISEDQDSYAIYIEDVRKIKSEKAQDIVNNLPQGNIDLLLISHQTSFFGATHYLYSLFNYIKSEYPSLKIKIAEQYEDSVLTAKYNLCSEDIIVYHNDPTVLWHITDKLNPKKILVNSASKIINPVLKHLDKDRRILHSHEVREHYQAVIKDITPDFVVSEKIAAQWEGMDVKIQPPFIDISTRELLDSAPAIATLSNAFGDIDFSKLTVGMCGDLSSRKNPKLFGQLAAQFKNINFVWVGGHDDFPVQGLRNLYHIRSVANPYSYFKIFDCFLLTAIIDPCPYVVLENLYLNNKVVVFRDSIFTAHCTESLGDCYFEYPGKIDEVSARAALENIGNKGSVVRETQKGRNYVLKNFSIPKKEFLDMLLT